MNILTNQINEILLRCVDEEKEEIDISPEYIASRGMKIMNPKSTATQMVEWVAVLQLRQMARAILRKQFEPTHKGHNNGDMFPVLQPRYPVDVTYEENGETTVTTVYRERMHMSYEERQVMIVRLEKEATAKQQHADALRQETEQLMEQGYFAEKIAG